MKQRTKRFSYVVLKATTYNMGRNKLNGKLEDLEINARTLKLCNAVELLGVSG